MIDGNCDGCIFAFPTVTDDDDITVKCRRYPPVLLVLDEELIQSFPDADHRCGEYKEEPKPVMMKPEDPGRKLWRA